LRSDTTPKNLFTDHRKHRVGENQKVPLKKGKALRKTRVSEGKGVKISQSP